MHLRARFLLIASLIFVTAMAGLYLVQGRFTSTAHALPREKLVLATPRIAFSSLLFLAKHNDLFIKYGLDVRLVVTATGKEALDMTLAGKADIAAVATLPLVNAVASGSTPRILAVFAKSDSDYAIVARRDRNIAQQADLKDKTIGYVVGTGAEFYLEAFLINSNVARDNVQLKSITPQDSREAIVSGEVDAVALFSPWVNYAAQALGTNAILFAPSLHTTHWTLAADVPFIESRSTAAEKLLRALIDAQKLLIEQREKSLDALAQEMEIPHAELANNWERFSFEVQLPQSLIATLEREMMWIRSNTKMSGSVQTTNTAMPDFLDYISFSALQSVQPSAVRITR